MSVCIFPEQSKGLCLNMPMQEFRALAEERTCWWFHFYILNLVHCDGFALSGIKTFWTFRDHM